MLDAFVKRGTTVNGSYCVAGHEIRSQPYGIPPRSGSFMGKHVGGLDAF